MTPQVRDPNAIAKPGSKAAKARYAAYLKSPHWKSVKARYWASKRPKCCIVCGDPNFELHHRTYQRVGRERLDDLMPLCRTHHAKAHTYIDSLTPKQRRRKKATIKQLAYIRKLGGTPNPEMTIRAARLECERLQRKRAKRSGKRTSA